MSSSKTPTAIKRSAPNWRANGSVAASVAVQQRKRHRPCNKSPDKPSVEGINKATDGDGIYKTPTSDFHLDVISKIASFVDSGESLLNLLVALGPVESKKIRRDYLQNNDAHLVQSLCICRRAMAPAIRLSQPNSSNVLNLYQLSAKLFDK